MEKIQMFWLETLGGSKVGYLYFMCVSSVSSVKVVPKGHQSLILLILAASLILNTKICT